MPAGADWLRRLLTGLGYGRKEMQDAVGQALLRRQSIGSIGTGRELAIFGELEKRLPGHMVRGVQKDIAVRAYSMISGGGFNTNVRASHARTVGPGLFARNPKSRNTFQKIECDYSHRVKNHERECEPRDKPGSIG